MVALGLDVSVESDSGRAASFSDQEFKTAGASIEPSFQETVKKAEILLKIHRPLSSENGTLDELSLIPKGSTVIGILDPLGERSQIQAYNARFLTSFSLDLMPRITRAQGMDVLSSQANLAGYRAVIEAAALYQRAFPLMMTAAGTVSPARVLILGAGVAGLQAIATARRLGAVVSAFDVRPSVKEQVESLGATFIQVEETAQKEVSSGYAQEMSEAYQQKQAAKIEESLAKADIVITTALIPGKPAPLLIPESMLHALSPGSVIVDLAAERGGNCAVTQKDQVIEYRGIKVVGYTHLPSRIAQEASRLYARNIFNFLTLLLDPQSKEWVLNRQDDIVQSTLITHDGATVHKAFIS